MKCLVRKLLLFHALAIGLALCTAASRAELTIRAEPKCAASEYGAQDKGELAQFDRDLRRALSTGNREAIALLSFYPLRINGPEGSKVQISNPQALEQHYDAIFSSALVESILETAPETISCMSSGVMYANGTLWVRPTVLGNQISFRIGVVNTKHVSSGSDSSMQNRLAFICEAPSLRAAVYRLPAPGYRLRIWNKPHSIFEEPDLEIVSSENSESIQGTGECAHRLWRFEHDNSKYALAERGCTDGSKPDGAIGNFSIETSDLTQHASCQ